MNVQIEAAVAFSGQHWCPCRVGDSEFATRHRHRVAPRRIDDTQENAVQFVLQSFYRKEFLYVQISKYNCSKITGKWPSRSTSMRSSY